MDTQDRAEQIHAKGFDLYGGRYNYNYNDPIDYGRKIKVGTKTLDDAVLKLGDYNRIKWPN
ncbi:MAG: hypothetical protein PUJ51_18355 [Clostridiales bacterium]|nr:hypothetical protein [Clostridiales bacterium]